jgi:hypothetical protein
MTKDEALDLALEALTVLLDEWTPARQAQLKGMEAVTAINQARSAPVCNPHPKAPHGFNRSASHSADRYVCDCEGWDAYDAGYQAGIEDTYKRMDALDKKADNARELGLDYEPVLKDNSNYRLDPSVAEPVASAAYDMVDRFLRNNLSSDADYAEYSAALDALYTTQPAAQPAVPDAFGTREGEHPQYIQGWNDCRAEMLSMRKRVKP